jgi:hypothetical protein
MKFRVIMYSYGGPKRFGEEVMAFLKVLFRHLPDVTEYNHEIPLLSQCPGAGLIKKPTEYKSDHLTLEG